MFAEFGGQTSALGTLKVMTFSPSSWMRLNNTGEQMTLGVKGIQSVFSQMVH